MQRQRKINESSPRCLSARSDRNRVVAWAGFIWPLALGMRSDMAARMAASVAAIQIAQARKGEVEVFRNLATHVDVLVNRIKQLLESDIPVTTSTGGAEIDSPADSKEK
ncbi:MAG: hypothetical protein A2Y76_11370 [Planctomycetes bacterium RBG_13_60_9]|nr:MAG: hypothetical protein A2Y76_11370 [Planctomycetes bacterium RBG_13_60_9]